METGRLQKVHGPSVAAPLLPFLGRFGKRALPGGSPAPQHGAGAGAGALLPRGAPAPRRLPAPSGPVQGWDTRSLLSVS